MKECGFQFKNTYTNLPEGFYSHLRPIPVSKPGIVILNEDLAKTIGLDFSNLNAKEQANLFVGNTLPDSSEPFAQAYAGHQFGHFTMLGDGRALILGEHITPDKKRLDIQFKGSGRTPYSRQADGRAGLSPMLREYVISEAMNNLGIPTTRSLAVATTGEQVIRQIPQPGAILTRIASSHIRVGTFEFAASKRDSSLVSLLLDYTIKRHIPDLIYQLKNTNNQAIAFLFHVMNQQADLITNWMRVGFIHGVMNTDNMAISGETLDYGPCAFMDSYNPQTVFSSIDHMSRYAYANQPIIAQWNIARLAETLLPLIDTDIHKAIDRAEEAVNHFPELYKAKWLTMMRSKLGLFGTQDGDEKLINDLLDWMHINHTDYTTTFRELSFDKKPDGKQYQTKTFAAWYDRWQMRLRQNTKPPKSSQCLMKNVNPSIIPRNHKVEEALAAACAGDLKPFHKLLAALKEPYKDTGDLKLYQMPPDPTNRSYQTYCGT